MEKKSNNVLVGMSVFGAIFFIFGFATTFIIQLSAPVMAVFNLTEFQAQLLTSSFFIAYPIMSIPTGILINRIGYKWTVSMGLILMAIGSLVFIPAAKIPSYPLFLMATFILATGVVFLQVSANPYVTAIGPESGASSRLNLTQALNSIATMVAPWLIAVVIFRGLELPAQPTEAQELAYGLEVATRIPFPFIVMALIVAFVAVVLFMIKLPVIAVDKKDTAPASVYRYPHVLMGAFGIFCYVGAEVGNAGLMVNYLRGGTLGLSAEMASTYAAIYWGGAMVGRFFGSIMFSDIAEKSKKFMLAGLVLILAFVSGAFVTEWNWQIGGIFTGVALVNFIIMQFGFGKPARTLAIFALMAGILGLVTTFTTGHVALWTVVSIGLFNSIMFPNIFSLAVKDLKGGELGSASGIINALIIGGAIIPPLMGSIADNYGYTYAYIVPALCYLYIFFFAVKGSKIRPASMS
ncbi:sugar MFS transporter [Natronoflexus pectinivorans]|uniref:FHS family L-fucose permease-like MFS transporter n=1 Tax=Natronoflexus pectinivorans TaxID=682526 RepID=A0A4V2RWT5_9BACT|nr:sugar MFS transporter [Natronoflexus pectinivorans]TCO09901.1 FHS family L-fucose permease-like MFS transporter [Natronoflexus pectinivorans]